MIDVRSLDRGACSWVCSGRKVERQEVVMPESIGEEPLTPPRAFLVRRKDNTERLFLADSWGESPADGVIRFFDDHGMVCGAVAMNRVQDMTMLRTGPVVWEAGVGPADAEGNQARPPTPPRPIYDHPVG